MNGFVHFLREQLKAVNILILSKEHQTATLAELYSGYPEVSFITIKGDEEIFGDDSKKLLNIIKHLTSEGYQTVPFGIFSGSNKYLELDSCWANCFYLQHKIPPSVRFDYFRLPKDLSGPEAVYKKLINRIGKDYIVIHDDPSREITLDYPKVVDWLKEHKLETYPVIYLGKDRYKYPFCQNTMNPNCKDILAVDSVIDYLDVLRNATAVHMMDSSLAILLDLSKPPETQHRVSYIRYSAFPTEGLYQSKWTYVK